MGRKVKKKRVEARRIERASGETVPSWKRGWRWLAVAVVVTGAAAMLEAGLLSQSGGRVSASSLGIDTPGRETVSRGPRADDEVLAYDSTSGDWQPRPLASLGTGSQLSFEGRFYRIDPRGKLRVDPHLSERSVARTDRLPEGDSTRFPEATDIVRFLHEDRSHWTFDRMGTLRPGSQFLFQGRLYRGVDDPRSPTGVSVENTGIELSRVSHKFRSSVDSLIDLQVVDEAGRGATITGTAEHPFYVPSEEGYIPMGGLSPGMVLATGDGSRVTVVEASSRSASSEVHNFEVEDNHNYYVTADEALAPVLVHNICELDFVRLKRSRQLGNEAGGKRTFALTPDELDFVKRVREDKPNLQIFRTNQKANLGDFLIVDRSNPKANLGFVVDLKTGGGSAGNQLQNASAVPTVKALKIDQIETASGTTEELLELFSRGRAAFPQGR